MSITTELKPILFSGLIAVLSFFSIGCESEEQHYQVLPMTIEQPSNFPQAIYDVSVNPLNTAGFELGKKLFYDGRLASDGVVSCGFCHIQRHAFTHHGHTMSHGVNDGVGKRNAPPLQNLAFTNVFMWDGVSDHLDLQPLIPLTSEVEMNGELPAIIAMLQEDPDYPRLFSNAFANGQVNAENMLKALSQFMVQLVSSNSRFDKYRRNETGGTFDPMELQGYALFLDKCESCHSGELQTDNSFRNNGLAVNPLLEDFGRFEVTLWEQDRGRFKVPSLRNIEVTAPYMHDGRFFTLDAVLDHYSSGVQDSPSLDASLRNNGSLGIPLSGAEKSAILSFLKTLTDDEFLSDPKFSEF